MGYHIQLFRKEVKEAEIVSDDDEFFEKQANLLPFTAEQAARLNDLLLRYRYKPTRTFDGHQCYEFNDEDEYATAMLTKNAIYFSASGDGIFEISMTSSELTDCGEFAKYDPQNGGWEN